MPLFISNSKRRPRSGPILLSIAAALLGVIGWRTLTDQHYAALEPMLTPPALQWQEEWAATRSTAPLMMGNSTLSCAVIPSVLQKELHTLPELLWSPGNDLLAERVLRYLRDRNRPGQLVIFPLGIIGDRPRDYYDVPTTWPKFRTRIDTSANFFAEQTRQRWIRPFGVDGPTNNRPPLQIPPKHILGTTKMTEQYMAYLDSVLERLKELQAQGWNIVAVFPPVSRPSDRRFTQRVMIQAACTELNIPVLDYHDMPHISYDGIHLHASEMVRFSQRLGEDLKNLGWGTNAKQDSTK